MVQLSVNISDKVMEVLNILSRKSRRDKSELTEEALTFLFEEYKELILDT